jgi:glycosyltransferase involved in cell wall biosynthesis
MNAFVPVSVVIPCYRCARTIKRAIDSVFQQTQKPIEVILVDDASGDDTLSALLDLEKKYAGWIQVIKLNENLGAASARNSGWAMATQPYISFLDADDSWHPEKLCIQYEFMGSNQEVMLSGHRCILLDDGVIMPNLPEDLHTTKISASSLLFKNAFSTPTVMLKREVTFRFQEGKRFAEDFLLWQQIAFSGLQVVRIESPLAYVHKPLYGISGLSMHLWEMEKGELSNFITLYRDGGINLILYVVATLFSIIKYFKRVLVTLLNKLSKLLKW